MKTLCSPSPGLQLRYFASACVWIAVCVFITSEGQAITAQSEQPPQVLIDAGTLQGARDASGVFVFRGIPYAAPPVQQLRWRPPHAVEHWSGIRPATAFGARCPQQGSPGGSEDCLFLNVWTATTDTGARRPVIVWIHGGGGVGGTGAAPAQDGRALAAKGAVVVTLNHRLGLLGYLAHPALSAESPQHVSGNYALLDQIAVLQWVQRNIAGFGGDAARVTLAGASAGARSVATLLVSPLASGLFHRAILQSGTGMNDAVESREAAEAHGVRVAEMLGITETTAAAASTLRASSPETLVSTFSKWRLVIEGPPAPTIARSVIDGWAIPQPVDKAMQAGTFHPVPILIGTNADEGTVAIRDTPMQSASELHDALRRWYHDAEGILARTYPVSNANAILPTLQRLWGDESYGAPSRAFARLAAGRGNAVYVYHFTRVGEGPVQAPGAFHGSETWFAFGQSALDASLGHTRYDASLARTMSDYWVAFAASGDPNGSDRTRWPRYNAAADEYLELGRDIRTKRGLRSVEWDALDRLARSHGAIRP